MNVVWLLVVWMPTIAPVEPKVLPIVEYPTREDCKVAGEAAQQKHGPKYLWFCIMKSQSEPIKPRKEA